MKNYIVILFIIFQSYHVTSQVIYNSYGNVTSVNSNTLTISNLNEPVSFSFTPGNPVILFQIQDDVIGTNTLNNVNFGDLATAQSAGLWEEIILNSIIRSGTNATVVLSGPTINSYNTGSNSRLQIVSFPLLNAAAFSTTNNIVGTPWDGNIGGIVAFRVGTNLTLNHNVSADGIGFRGGIISTNYYPGGTTCDTIADTWRQGSNIRGGKGEGIYRSTNNIFNHGKAKILNGGGGGSNINAGGGGGGNWTAGGNGGPGWPGTCPSPGAAGRGGINLSSIITSNRIFMGGGGGGGQQNNSASTAGGRGGGIVIIRANQILTSGACGTPRRISANGLNAALAGNDGGGGGGAAGTVILQVNSYSIQATCQLSISANGGNGSTVNTSTHAGGGAGAQGVVVFSVSQPTLNTITSTNNGIPGCNNSSNPCNSPAGSASGANNSGIFSNISTALPIELLEFNAKKEGKRVRLTWTTSVEVNNDFFTIQKSGDGYNFSALEKVKSKGNNGNSNKPITYTAFDLTPLPDVNYYRLKQTDFDGKDKYHKITSIKYAEPSSFSVNVFPNPNNGNFKVKLSGLESQSYLLIELYDISGRIIDKKEIPASSENEEIEYTLRNNISNGIYFLKAIVNEQMFPFKVSVEN